MRNNKFYLCRICGLEQSDLPWGEDNESPTFNICSCCGVEFGYEDINLSSIKRYRNLWVSNGARWFVEKEKPDEWSLELQLSKIPKEYLDVVLSECP